MRKGILFYKKYNFIASLDVERQVIGIGKTLMTFSKIKKKRAKLTHMHVSNGKTCNFLLRFFSLLAERNIYLVNAMTKD